MATTTPKTTNSSRRRTVIQAFTKPPRSAFLPLARACHRAHCLRHSQVDDPSGSLAVPHFISPFVRTQPLLRGVLLVLLATVLVFVFALQGVFTDSGGLVLSRCIRRRRHLHPALPDRPRGYPTAGRDAWHPRFSARHDDRVVPERFAQPFRGNLGKPRLHPVWELATVPTAVSDRFLGHPLCDELARLGGQLGLGAWLCLAQGARRCKCSTPVSSPWSCCLGARVWPSSPRRAARFGLPGSALHKRGSSVLQATLPEKLAGAFLRDSNAG